MDCPAMECSLWAAQAEETFELRRPLQLWSCLLTDAAPISDPLLQQKSVGLIPSFCFVNLSASPNLQDATF